MDQEKKIQIQMNRVCRFGLGSCFLMSFLVNIQNTLAYPFGVLLLIAVFLCMCLRWKNGSWKEKRYLPGLILSIFLCISCTALGRLGESRGFLLGVVPEAVFLVPLSFCLGQEESEKVIRRFLSAECVVYSALLFLCYVAIWRGRNFSLFNGFLTLGAKYSEKGILIQLFDLYFYTLGFLCAGMSFASFYLFLSRKSPWGFLWLLCTAILVSGVVVTMSRLCLACELMGILMLGIVILLHRGISRKKIVLFFITGLGIASGIWYFGMNFIYTKVTFSPRNVFSSLKTLGLRLPIWKTCWTAIKDNPDSWLFGFPAKSALNYIFVNYAPGKKIQAHAHNGWLQSLVVGGFPTLLYYLYITFLVIRTTLRTWASKLPLAEKVLPLVLVVWMMTNTLDCTFFQAEIISMTFMLLVGYLIERERITSEK